MPDINTISFENFFETYNMKDNPVNKDDMEVIIALFHALSRDRKNAEAVDAGMLNSGLLSFLSDNERNALVLDPEIRLRMSIRNGELYFDDISLETRSPKADTGRLEELKKSISVSCNAHLVEHNARFIDLDAYNLNQNNANLKDALSLLDSTNRWYNSSDAFRRMYNSIESLSKRGEKLKPEDLNAENPLACSAYLKDLTDARAAVENYLTHKGALDGKKVRFKNSYEADRVAAARGLLRALKAKEFSFSLSRKVVEARAKYDRFADYLAREHHIDREKLENLKYDYCSMERVRMHEIVKAVVSKMNKSANAAAEEFKMKYSRNIPPEFRGTLGTYIKADNPEHNERVLYDISRIDKHPTAKRNMQNRYMSGLSSARSLEKNHLAVNENQDSTACVRYAIDHLSAVVQGEQIPFSKQNMSEILGVTAKDDGINAEINKAYTLGKAGSDLIKLMADDNAFFLPLDEFVINDQIADFVRNDAHLKNSSLTDADKESLNKFYECVISQTKELPGLGEIRPQALKSENFKGVIPEKAKAEKQLSYRITTGPDVLTSVNADVFVQGPINDDEPLQPVMNVNDNRRDSPDRMVPDEQRKPEQLLDEQISRMHVDDVRKAEFMQISTAIRNARSRLEANSGVHNIYPEAADDMKLLVIAEEIKNEIMYKRNNPVKDTKNFLVERLLSNTVEEPGEKFLDECESRDLGKDFNQKIARVKDIEKQENLMFSDDMMKDFAGGNGAKRAFETCLKEKVTSRKMKGSNVNVQSVDSSRALY